MYRIINITGRSRTILILLFISCNYLINAQWHLLSGGKSDVQYNCGLAFSKTTAVMAGNKGCIHRTSDGGNTWEVISNNSLLPLSGTCKIDSLRGWIVGDSGLVMKTVDGGKSWAKVNINSKKTLLNVFFISPSTGWITGYETVLKTTDGGITWSNSFPYLSGNKFTSLHFITPLYGAIIQTTISDTLAHPVILLTSNGGSSWSQIPENSIRPRAIRFLSSSNAVCFGEDTAFYRSTDGGKNWTRTYKSPVKISTLISFNPDCVFAGCENGKMCISNDGGITWNLKSTNVSIPLLAVLFADNQTGWAGGYESLILKTTNGGADWLNQQHISSSNYTQVFFINETTGWATADGSIYKTSDGGNSWGFQISTGASTRDEFRFFSADTGFILTAAALYKTQNGGLNWNRFTAFIMVKYFSFPARDTGYLIGIDKTLKSGIFKTVNGGESWTYLSANLGSSYFINSNVGWVAGSDSKLYKTSDAGLNWTTYSIAPVTGRDLLFFTNESRGWLRDNSYILYRTDDSGKTWREISPVPALQVVAYTFFGENVGWALFTNGIYATTNGGDTWTMQLENADYWLSSLCMLNRQTGWAVGTNGTVLKTTNGGMTAIDDKHSIIPASHQLKQNYPNPFNPETNISYDISTESYVSLEVYDLLGRELANLVNARQMPGRYTVTFNAANFTSGIYFYKLHAGNFSETKKMLLLK